MLLKKLQAVQAALVVALLAMASVAGWAQAPAGYYKSAEGKSGAQLLKALEAIVGPHTVVSYNGLWQVYKKSDVTAQGKIWDMYSTSQYTPGNDQCGSYSEVGQCYNREHSMPKSWFGDASPMVSDAFHIVPTDGKVNAQRGNYPYGECAGGTNLGTHNGVKALGRLGTSTFPGYTGTVFEPDDQYKGDFARNYFYMATAYNDKIAGWNSPMLAKNDYPAFTDWAVNLLLKWSREDPVSPKETNRNNAVYTYQHNRNPFIDNPELAEYIWGDKKTIPWYPGGATGAITQPDNGLVIDLGITGKGMTLTKSINVKGSNLTHDLAVTVAGAGFGATVTSITAAQANAGYTLTVTFSSDKATTATGSLTLSSSEATTTVKLNAEAVDGIPALEATNISAAGFRANWMNINGPDAKYELHVACIGVIGTTYDPSRNYDEMEGYPVEVNAADEHYDVYGHSAMAYVYWLTSQSGLTSNKVQVSTDFYPSSASFQEPEGGFTFTCKPGEESPILEGEATVVDLYKESATLDVHGNFEASLDRINWSTSIPIRSVAWPVSTSPEPTYDDTPTTFYVRIADTSKEGTYDGELVINDVNQEARSYVQATIGNPVSFIEDFEKAPTGGYWTKDVQGSACLWHFANAGVWGDAAKDHPSGKQCVRLGKNSSEAWIAMADDKMGGASKIAFDAAAFGSDPAGTIAVSYSTNGGSTWTKLKDVDVAQPTGNALNHYEIATGDIKGNVRFKLERTAGNRFNIDNIAITDASSSAIALQQRGWDAYAAPQQGITLVPVAGKATSFKVWNMDAQAVFSGRLKAARTIELPAGVYVVVAQGTSKKVVVR